MTENTLKKLKHTKNNRPMKTLKIFTILSLFILFSSCKTDSVEEYFVNATENGDFFVTSIPTSFVQFDTDKLDAETIKQIASIKKVNILLYQNNVDQKEKEIEYKKASNAIENKHYKTLAKINDKEYQLSFSYLGSAQSIDEIIFLGKDSKYNFLIGKIKGNGVRVKDIIKALKHVKTVDDSQAKPILKMFEGLRKK